MPKQEIFKKIDENLILIAESFEEAKENYGYDLANESHYLNEIIKLLTELKKL